MTQFTHALAPHLGDAATRQVYDHLGALCRIVLDGRATGGALSVVEERARQHYMTPRHLHEREAETFVVLDGELEGWAAGDVQRVAAGNLIHLPAGIEHAFRVTSPTAHFLTLVTPAGFEEFFVRSGVPLSEPFDGELPWPGPLSAEQGARLQEILAPLGCSLTGPPPFDVA